MLKYFQNLSPFILILIATIFEVSGDAIIRKALYTHGGLMRIGWLLTGGILVFLYGLCLNLAPVEFGEVVGLYIATLFVVWQVITFISFGTLPSLPIVVGGSLIVLGGLVITYWKTP